MIEWIERVVVDERLIQVPTELPEGKNLTEEFEWHAQMRNELLRNRVDSILEIYPKIKNCSGLLQRLTTQQPFAPG